MKLHPLAGTPAPKNLLIDTTLLERAYYEQSPNLANPAEGVSFGTSGHRGVATASTFNEAHIHAITQALCDYRALQKIDGPLFIGKDTHALSAPAERSALEVLAANGVEVVMQSENGFVPTPVISHAILGYNRTRYGTKQGLADGIIITPSHNPPEFGGFKYNPPHGGPAEKEITSWVERRANDLLKTKNAAVRKIPYTHALNAATTRQHDFVPAYVEALSSVLDMEAIRSSTISLGVDPLGGAALRYWEAIKEHYKLNLTLVSTTIDPTFRFMTLDHDGQIRMDCSSPYAMAPLVQLRDKYDVACGTDPDADRHGIVSPSIGLLNPNHFLAVAIRHLLATRNKWSPHAIVGKTVVSSSLIDRVVAASGRTLAEVPVGFKWFVQGLFDGSFCFGGEESAGASFLRRDGTVWSTDKDGIIMGLLAAEITAVTGSDPGIHATALAETYGTPYYTRIDAPATLEQKARLKKTFAYLDHINSARGRKNYQHTH